MGTFSNTPDAKVEAHDLVEETGSEDTQAVDRERDSRYTDVVSRENNKSVDKSERNPAPTKKATPKSVRPNRNG